ncbi:MAG: O-methyltransferase [Blastocatellia bacterium]|nr:O-methyltransferase [Blastocatellia bacterium]
MDSPITMNHIFDLESEFLAIFELCKAETMTSIERMYALYQATCYVLDCDVPGDFVECGVWRGGSVMLMAYTLLSRGCTDRTIWLYDTFDGGPPPGDNDVQEISGRRAQDILDERERSEDDPFWAIAPRALVESNLQRTGYPMQCFRFISGDVMVTMPGESPARLAVLRLDTDWYQSTRHELKHLYPRLSPGGVLIIDDYGYWRGARKATDEYFQTVDTRPLLNRIDYTGRICVKPFEGR